MRRLLLSLPLCFLPASEGVSLSLPSALPELTAAGDSTPLPDAAGLERLARNDPIAFQRACLRRYDREVKGYRCTFVKQERLGGKLQRTEVVDVSFRDDPFSVVFDWREGAKLAAKLLYVKGQNDGQMLVRPGGWRGALVSTVSRDPVGADAKESSRYPITDFGMKKGLERAIAAWGAAQQEGSLKYEYRGKRKIPETGDRECYILHRFDYRQPEEDGITDATLYYDVETWLQTGSTLKGADRQLIGEYWFRDIKLNPDFAPATFTRAGLTK
jgi:Protein of unknown function (DUF1571)